MPSPEWIVSCEATLDEMIELDRLGPNEFRATPRSFGRFSIYGGELAVDVLVAAARTVEPGRLPLSLRISFVAPAQPDADLVLDVEVLRDGGALSRRSVRGRQEGRVVVSGEVAFATPRRQPLDTDRHELSVAEPDTVSPTVSRPVEWRPLDPEGAQAWLRMPSRIQDDPLLRASALVYASDLSLGWRGWPAVGITSVDAGIAGTSIEHSVWFHRPVSPSQWLLFSQRCVGVTGGVSLCLADVLDPEGNLVASVAQQSLMSLAGPPSDRPDVLQEKLTEHQARLRVSGT